MIILQVVFSIFLMIAMGAFMIFGVYFMTWAIKWIAIVCGLCTGNKKVIQEFDCREKEPWSFDKMVEGMVDMIVTPNDRLPYRRRHTRHGQDLYEDYVSWRDQITGENDVKRERYQEREEAKEKDG